MGMDLFSAITKSVFRFANRKSAEHDRQKAKDIAYKNTGKEIKAAKRKGEYVNGSKAYKRNLSKQMDAVEQKHTDIDNFISDL